MCSSDLYYVSNCGIETGIILSVGSPGATPANQTGTALLSLTNCSGYQAGVPGWRIQAGGDCLQYVEVRNCKFYGITVNRVCYSLGSPVSIEPQSFQNISVDFYQTLACKNLYNYPGFICVDQDTSSDRKSTRLNSSH